MTIIILRGLLSKINIYGEHDCHCETHKWLNLNY
jgi:hypothetical protein